MTPASLAPPLLAAPSSFALALGQAGASAGPAASPTLGAWVGFFALAGLVIGGALLTVTRKNAVSAVMALVASFFGLAGMYLLLAAPFLAALQVLVYAGAIMTLFVFVVMVLNREEAEPWAMRGMFVRLLGVAAVTYLVIWGGSYLFGETIGLTTGAPVPLSQPLRAQPAESFGTVAGVGDLLFNAYVFPFEALSLMLLIAVIGAVVVARTPRKLDDHGGGLSHHAAGEPGHEAVADAEAH